MERESRLLVDALRRAVTGTGTPVPDQVDMERFYKLTCAHQVTALAWEGIKDLPNLPEELKKRFSATYFQAIFLDSQYEYTKQNLHERLQQANVDHVFLKGSRLKYDYPTPALRTMCDLDILVHTHDYDAITQVAVALGGESYYGDGNHHNFKFPGNVAVEFHPNLVHPGTIVGTQLNPGWQYAVKDDTGAWEMTPEGMYLHTMAHLAEHFVHGGVGVRFILDIWILRNRSKPADRAFVEKELARSSLLEFARKIEALAEMWFGQGENTPLLEELGEYIMTSGLHGLSKRAMLNAVSLSQGGNRASALFHKVFYPRRELETRYPWVEGKPLLLPIAWCARAWGAVTKRGHLIRKWSEGTAQVSKEETQQQREKMERFGIHRRK